MYPENFKNLQVNIKLYYMNICFHNRVPEVLVSIIDLFWNHLSISNETGKHYLSEQISNLE